MLFAGWTIKGRYRMIHRLASGETATTYLAEEVSTGHQVVLNVWPGPSENGEGEASRFLERASRLVALSKAHHGIARVYECDRADDGRPFIAMEHLDGRSLDELMRQDGPVAVGRALRLAIEIGEALEAAHNLGIIHANLDPQHVLVVGPEETIKLQGFEIAGLSEKGGADRAAGGATMGASEYMAPEQLQGSQITERTDIYALGVLLHQMLTGVGPFSASTRGTVLAEHLQEAPVPLRKARPDVPPSVEQIVMRALEEKPDRRQPDMSYVVNSLWIEMGRLEGGRRTPGGFRPPIVGANEGKKDRSATRWKLLGAGSLLVLVAVLGSITVNPSGILGFREAPDPAVPAPAPARSGLGAEGSKPQPAVSTSERPRGLPDAAAGEPRPLVSTPGPPVSKPEAAVRGPGSFPKPEAPGSTPELAGSASRPSVSKPKVSLTRPGQGGAFPDLPPRPPDSYLKRVTAQDRENVVRRSLPVVSGDDPDATRSASSPAPSRGRVSGEEADAPDPGAIIDWLLNEGSARGR
jgi:serine/threonine-protein kinase